MENLSNLTKEQIRAGIQIDRKMNKTIQQIADKYGVCVATVQKWKDRDYIKEPKRKRKTKFNKYVKNFMYKLAANKFTGYEKASSRKIARRIAGKFKIKIGHTTVNNYLRTMLKKPRRAQKTFICTSNFKEQRLEFANYLKENDITGGQIFFTDEKRFTLEIKPNPQVNQIRLTKKWYKKMMAGDEKIYEKVHKPLPKFSDSFMVAGGISRNGPGKLIFCVGTMDNTMYQRALRMYKEDIDRLDETMYFQQDKASCHRHPSCKAFIRENLNSWDPELWPGNSPDLNPIEDIWSLMEERVNEKQYATLDEKKFAVQELWNKIPISLCKRLCDSFDARIEQILKSGGKRVNTKQLKKRKKETHFKRKWNDEDGITRIIYKDSLLEEMRVKSHKKYLTYINKLDKQFNTYVRNNWGFRNFVKNGADLRRSGRLDEELILKYEEYLEAKAPIVETMRDIYRMNCHEFYEHLNDELKLRCINEKEKNLVFINKPECLSYLDESTAVIEREVDE